MDNVGHVLVFNVLAYSLLNRSTFPSLHPPPSPGLWLFWDSSTECLEKREKYSLATDFTREIYAF